MIFREATIDDVPIIVRLLADDALGQTREQLTVPLPQSYFDAFHQIDIDDNHELVVVEDDGEVIGTMQLSYLPYLTYRGGTRAQIEAVRVRTDRRGEQVGKTMFQWAIDRVQARGVHVLQLTTDKKRPDALRFYENLGFKASHEGMKLHF